MAQKILNDGVPGSVFRGNINDNFTDLYTNKANKNHASSSSEFGVASGSNYGHVKVTTGNGLKNTSGVLSMDSASTSQKGAVQLVDNATTNDSTKAATASALKNVKDSAVVVYSGSSAPSSSLGKNGDIYIKTS